MLVTNRVQQHRSSVVTNDAYNAIIVPGSEHVGIVKPCNGRRNDAVRGKSQGIVDANLFQPRNVEVNLLVCIRVSRVVQTFVRECVRNVSKGIAICSDRKPCSKVIQFNAGQAPGIVCWRSRPDVRSCTWWLLELERRVDLVRIFDGSFRITYCVRIDVYSRFNRTISIVPARSSLVNSWLLIRAVPFTFQ